VLDFLAASRLDRKSTLVAFGGGVVGDVGGLAAALYMRGIPYVQLPTTLLAQVDSSVGGKTAVNLSAGKNLAGVFHQPSLVLADTSTLAMPEATYCSAQTTAPLPITNRRNPERAITPHDRGEGSGCPVRRSAVIRIMPAAVNRSPPTNATGTDSRATRMARYVVPHTMQTTIQAAKASVRSRGVETTGGNSLHIATCSPADVVVTLLARMTTERGSRRTRSPDTNRRRDARGRILRVSNSTRHLASGTAPVIVKSTG